MMRKRLNSLRLQWPTSVVNGYNFLISKCSAERVDSANRIFIFILFICMVSYIWQINMRRASGRPLTLRFFCSICLFNFSHFFVQFFCSFRSVFSSFSFDFLHFFFQSFALFRSIFYTFSFNFLNFFIQFFALFCSIFYTFSIIFLHFFINFV